MLKGKMCKEVPSVDLRSMPVRATNWQHHRDCKQPDLLELSPASNGVGPRKCRGARVPYLQPREGPRQGTAPLHSSGCFSSRIEVLAHVKRLWNTIILIVWYWLHHRSKA